MRSILGFVIVALALPTATRAESRLEHVCAMPSKNADVQLLRLAAALSQSQAGVLHDVQGESVSARFIAGETDHTFRTDGPVRQDQYSITTLVAEADTRLGDMIVEPADSDRGAMLPGDKDHVPIDAGHAHDLLRQAGVVQLPLTRIRPGDADGSLLLTATVPAIGSAFGPLWPLHRETFAVVGCLKPVRPVTDAERMGTAPAPVVAYIMRYPVSSRGWAAVDTAMVTGLLYWLAARALRFRGSHPAGSGWARFDPVRITQDALGFGSLARLQVLFFTMVIVATLTFIYVREGYLSDLSDDILTLLGIGGLSATLTKVVANVRAASGEDLTVRTDRWLIRHGIEFPPRVAQWRDLLTTGEEFDVFKFQSLVFSGIVGAWIMGTGLFDLSQFKVPPHVMELLGVSQALLIAGKATGRVVGLRRLNEAVRDAIAAEQALLDALPADDPYRQQSRRRGDLRGAGAIFAEVTLPMPWTCEPALALFQSAALVARSTAWSVLDPPGTRPKPSPVEPVDPPDDVGTEPPSPV